MESKREREKNVMVEFFPGPKRKTTEIPTILCGFDELNFNIIYRFAGKVYGVFFPPPPPSKMSITLAHIIYAT